VLGAGDRHLLARIQIFHKQAVNGLADIPWSLAERWAMPQQAE
jgi:hypothetical protein